MSKTDDIDVAIVGLGPAGASAAREIAARGYRVAAFERKHAAGAPVQCAEFVPALIDAEGAALAAARTQSISSMRTFVEDEPGDLTPDFPGVMIDRASFDAHLAGEARAHGADIHLATSVSGVSASGTVHLADGRALNARVLIGADGPHSEVGRAAGRINTDIVVTRQITVDLKQPHDATDIYLCDRLPGGYGWMFPRGEFANVGLGVTPQFKDRLKPELERLHARLVREGRVGTGVVRHTGGSIPVGGLMDPIAVLGDTLVLLAGDAAGLTNPVTGAGIAAAVVSGRLAGHAAADWLAGEEDAPVAYAEELGDTFGASLRRAKTRRARLLAAHAGEGATPAELRRGWIAYPQYWSADNVEKERHELLEA